MKADGASSDWIMLQCEPKNMADWLHMSCMKHVLAFILSGWELLYEGGELRIGSIANRGENGKFGAQAFKGSYGKI